VSTWEEALRASGYRLPSTDDALLEECEVSAFQASGPGGQHRNRTFSAIRLRHVPSGIVVIGRRERSQHRNRRDALERLRLRLEHALTPPKARKPTKRTKSSSERRLVSKRLRSETKARRRDHFESD
jgi:protein subunit release factor A